MNRTDPSPNKAFAPPVCRDEATAIDETIPKAARAPATTITILLRLGFLRLFMVFSVLATVFIDTTGFVTIEPPAWVKS